MLTAIDVQKLFQEQDRQGQVKSYRKYGKFLAVQTQTPCEVVTEINGQEETRAHAKAGDWIVQGPANEKFILSEAKFKARYLPTEDPLWFEAIGSCRAVSLSQSFEFMAPWGSPMIFLPGDYLACGGDPSDIYRVERSIFESTYKEDVA